MLLPFPVCLPQVCARREAEQRAQLAEQASAEMFQALGNQGDQGSCDCRRRKLRRPSTSASPSREQSRVELDADAGPGARGSPQRRQCKELEAAKADGRTRRPKSFERFPRLPGLPSCFVSLQDQLLEELREMRQKPSSKSFTDSGQQIF